MTSALRSLTLGMSLFCLAFSGRQNSSMDTDLVAHEWGPSLRSRAETARR
jgi:hypothetical protein